MIGLAILAIGCTGFAMFAMHSLSPRWRRILVGLGIPLGLYFIFVMPAGGADNPLPVLIGGWCLACAVAGIVLETAALLGRKAGSNG